MKFFAHRGASYLCRENTLLAFQHAIDLGCCGVEMDVRLTKDKVPILFHDHHHDGTPIHQIDYQDLLDSCPEVPRFKDIIDSIGNSCHLLIEVKAREAFEPVIAMLQTSKLDQTSFTIISYDHEYMQGLTGIRKGLVLDGTIFCMHDLNNYDLVIASSNWIRDPITLSVPVYCYTVNYLKEMERLEVLGIQGIVTDRIELFCHKK